MVVRGWFLFALLMVSGCSSLTVSTELHGQVLVHDLEPVAHVNARCWGVYMFNLIPLWTGSSEYPGSVRFFTDEVRAERLVDMVTHKAETLGGDVTTDLVSSQQSCWAELGLIFWLREAEVSGNVSKHR